MHGAGRHQVEADTLLVACTEFGVDNAELSSDAKDLGDAWRLDVTQCQGVGNARLAAEEDEDSARYRAARLARAKAGRLKVDSGARVARTGPPYPTAKPPHGLVIGRGRCVRATCE